MKRIHSLCIVLVLTLMLGWSHQAALAAGTDSLTGTEASPQSQTETPEPETGTIQVEVVNRSGGDVPIGADVILYGYDGNQVAHEQLQSLPEEGVVIFEQVPMVAGRVYVAATEHQGVRYGSTLAEITTETEEANIEIAVFDTTSDLSALAINQLHIFVEFAPNSARVIMLMLLTNTSEQTVTAENEGGPAFQVELPQQAINLQVQENVQLRYVQTEGGFGVTNIRPSDGPYEITFGFELPNQGDRVSLKMPVPLDTGSAVVFVPGGAAQLEGDRFQRGEDLDMQGAMYNIYSAAGLKAGDMLAFSLDDITDAAPSAPSGEESSLPITELQIGLSVLGAALIIVGLYFWWRNRQQDRETPLGKTEATVQSSQTEDLMDAIIALDDLYKVGELSEKEYQQRRAKLKERLRKAVEQQDLSGFGNPKGL